MKIKVTQEVIDECTMARKGWYNPCPLTHVLRKIFPRQYVIVNGIHILADKEYRVPRKAHKFMVDWDKKRDVKPISFFLVTKKGFWDKVLSWIENKTRS